MMLWLRYASAALLFLLLGSCASINAPPGPSNPDFNVHQQAVLAHPQWRLEGRLNVRQAKQSDTVTLSWQQQDENFDILLRGTLGLGSTRVHGSDAGLQVEKAGDPPIALPNLQALTRDYLNFEFPAANLLYWVRGLPVPGLQAMTEFDSNNLLTTLSQRDANGRLWQLTFDRYETVEMLPLPGRIRLSADDLQLTFLVSAWTLGGTP